jgi:DNA-binding IclR family transcriptional regulator
MIKSVAKAIDILNCFTNRKRVLSISEVAAQLDMTKSTVSRLLSTLSAQGCVEPAGGYGQYKLGYRIYLWSQHLSDNNSIVNISHPIMQKLANKSMESVSLYGIEGFKRICIDAVESPHEIAKVQTPGAILPLYAGASGKMLLAFKNRNEQLDILNQIEFEKFTDKTPTTIESIVESLDEIKSKGYGISIGEREDSAYSIVSPIWNASGDVVYSLSLSGPLFRYNEDKGEQLLEMVLDAGKEISSILGYNNKRQKN